MVNDPGSKFDKAQQLGVKILNEQAFLEIFKQWSIDREKMCFLSGFRSRLAWFPQTGDKTAETSRKRYRWARE